MGVGVGLGTVVVRVVVVFGAFVVFVLEVLGFLFDLPFLVVVGTVGVGFVPVVVVTVARKLSSTHRERPLSRGMQVYPVGQDVGPVPPTPPPGCHLGLVLPQISS